MCRIYGTTHSGHVWLLTHVLVLQNTKNKLNRKSFSNSLCLNVWYILTTTKNISVANQEFLIFRNETDYIKLILRPPKVTILKADIHQQMLIIWLCVPYICVFYISYIYWDKYAFSFLSKKSHFHIHKHLQYSGPLSLCT